MGTTAAMPRLRFSPTPGSARLRPRRAAAPLLAASLAASLAMLAGACSKAFVPRKFPTTLALYQASEHEYQRRHWDNALAGFDLLAGQLPARDTLLAHVYFYQGEVHGKKDEHLLAAQAYSRIIDAFPDDSLADDALIRTAREYQALWRKPTLDAQYGQTALSTYRQLLSLYPDSKLVPEAGREIAHLNGMFADKDFETAEHYMRRKAYDSAIIYLRDVTQNYPGTPAARQSYFRLLDAYRAIKYREDEVETCTEARKFYPDDAAVTRACSSVPVPATAVKPDSARADSATLPRRP